MRYGQNPTKFSRFHPDIVKLNPAIPAALTLTTITYVPHLSNYYQEGLDVLKLTLKAAKETVNCPNDLLVFDNGSCSEVVAFLNDLLKKKYYSRIVVIFSKYEKIGCMELSFYSCARGIYSIF